MWNRTLILVQGENNIIHDFFIFIYDRASYIDVLHRKVLFFCPMSMIKKRPCLLKRKKSTKYILSFINLYINK